MVISCPDPLTKEYKPKSSFKKLPVLNVMTDVKVLWKKIHLYFNKVKVSSEVLSQNRALLNDPITPEVKLFHEDLFILDMDDTVLSGFQRQ